MLAQILQRNARKERGKGPRIQYQSLGGQDVVRQPPIKYMLSERVMGEQVLDKYTLDKPVAGEYILHAAAHYRNQDSGEVHRQHADNPLVRSRHQGAGQLLAPTLIEMRQVVKKYEMAAGSFTALDNIDLAIREGEFVAVVGRSGSGKSTLINMITGIDRPSAGSVQIRETAVQHLDEGQAAVWRGRHIGVIFQFFQLLPTLSILENVMLPMDFCKVVPFSQRKERAMHLLDLVEMAPHAHKLPTATSGGQQQRVAIARALANDPPLIVADEPTGNLDSRTAESVFRLFENLVAIGKTVLVVTHDSELAQRMKRVITIADGQIVDDVVVDSG